jgi:ABC-type taurine transport system substrate-binding protein
MKSANVPVRAGAALILSAASASAGPIPVLRHDIVAPPRSEATIEVHYRGYRHSHRSKQYRRLDPGAAAAAAVASGLLSLGTAAALGGYRSCGYYGCHPGWQQPYGYGYSYGYPW